MGEDVHELSLNLDLQNIDLDAILLPFEPKTGSRHRKGPPRPFDVVAAQRQALEQDPADPSSAAGFAAAGGASAGGVGRPQVRARAEHSLLHGPALGGGRCGERMQFTVTVGGSDGSILRTGGHKVTALVHGLDIISKYYPEPRPWVEDNEDGNFNIQFVCATPGRYDITACVDGVPLPMCPVRVEVIAGPANAMKSDLGGTGTQSCEVGQKAEFTIFARDEFGNPCTEGGARFGIRALGHAQTLEVADNEDGTYSVVYHIPEYCQGPVRLEVLLDSVPVKGSPICPRIEVPERPTPALPPAEGPSVPGLSDQIEALRWLREHPPVEVPELPHGAASLPSGTDPAQEAMSAYLGDTSAARMAWRAADEWRKLNEVREEMERARRALLEHQAVLLSVGGAVHNEFVSQQDRARTLDSKCAELGEVETRLDVARNELWRQQMNRQKALIAASSPADAGGSPPRGGTSSPLGSPAIRGSRSPSPDFGGGGGGGGRRPPAGGGGGGGAYPSSPQRVGDWHNVPSEYRGSPIPAAPPPSYVGRGRDSPVATRGMRNNNDPLPPPLPPPALDSDQYSRSRVGMGGSPYGSPSYYGGGVQDPLPPPSPPPVLDSRRPYSAGAGEGAAASTMGGRSGDRSYGTGSGGLIASPPPPPAPPPAVLTAQTDFSPWASTALNSRSPREALKTPQGRPRAAAAVSSGQGGGSGGHTPEELGQAMRHLFHAFASRDPGSQDVRPGMNPRAGVRGQGRSGRVTMGLQDYLRLTNAAQIRLPNGELEAVFRATARRFGSGTSGQAEPTLPFELFVELLVETARMRYGDLRDAESTAALFEEHLLPLSQRLRELDDLGTSAVAAAAAAATE